MPFTYTVKARVTLERVKRSKRIRSYLMEQRHIRILQNIDDGVEHTRVKGSYPMFGKKYWRMNAAGHTSNELEAAIQPGERALELSGHCGPEKGIVYEVLKEHDERTQEEMPKPRIEFVGYKTDAAKQPYFEYKVNQIMSQGRDGRGLEFFLRYHWNTYRQEMKYSVHFGDELPESIEQLTRWHRAVAFALANLRPPKCTIPLW